MGSTQLSLVALAMLAGLIAVLTPGLPGPLVCWAAVLWWATAVHTPSAWYVLFGSAVVLALGQVLKWLAPGHRLRDSGISRQTLFSAGVCGIAGFFVVPVVGGVLGFVGGLYAQLRYRLGGHAAARAATRVAMRGIGLAVLAELFTCLLVAGGWATAVALS
jgi:uncharacterized protein